VNIKLLTAFQTGSWFAFYLSYGWFDILQQRYQFTQEVDPCCHHDTTHIFSWPKIMRIPHSGLPVDLWHSQHRQTTVNPPKPWSETIPLGYLWISTAKRMEAKGYWRTVAVFSKQKIIRSDWLGFEPFPCINRLFPASFEQYIGISFGLKLIQPCGSCCSTCTAEVDKPLEMPWPSAYRSFKIATSSKSICPTALYLNSDHIATGQAAFAWQAQICQKATDIHSRNTQNCGVQTAMWDSSSSKVFGLCGWQIPPKALAGYWHIERCKISHHHCGSMGVQSIMTTNLRWPAVNFHRLWRFAIVHNWHGMVMPHSIKLSMMHSTGRGHHKDGQPFSAFAGCKTNSGPRSKNLRVCWDCPLLQNLRAILFRYASEVQATVTANPQPLGRGIKSLAGSPGRLTAAISPLSSYLEVLLLSYLSVLASARE